MGLGKLSLHLMPSSTKGTLAPGQSAASDGPAVSVLLHFLSEGPTSVSEFVPVVLLPQHTPVAAVKDFLLSVLTKGIQVGDLAFPCQSPGNLT